MSQFLTQPAVVGLEMRWLQPLYGRLADRPVLLEALERESGLRRTDPSDLGRMTHSDFCHLLERLHASGEPHICAWLAMQFDAGVGFGQVYFLRSCTDLREMLSDLLTHQPLLFPFGSYHLSVDWDARSFEISLQPALPAPRLATSLLAEGAMAWVKRFIDISLCLPAAPLSVCSNVPEGDMSHELAELFGAQGAFRASVCALRFPAALLEQPFPGGNQRIKQAMRAGFIALLRNTDAPIPLPLRLIAGFETYGDTQKITLASVAERIGATEAGLRNELHGCGMRFSDILIAHRRRQAFQLLVQEGTPVEAVVPVLGYSSRFALERAFAGWFGTSPATARQQRIQLTTHALSEDWCDPVALLRLLPGPTNRILDTRILGDTLLPASPLVQAYLLGVASRAEHGGRAVVDPCHLVSVLGVDQLGCLVRALHLQAAKDESTAAIKALMQARQGVAERLCASPWFLAMEESARRQTALEAALYEIGALLMHRRFGKPYTELLLASTPRLRTDVLGAEKRLFGIDRHIAASMLFAAWGLPASFIQTQRDASQSSTPYVHKLAQFVEPRMLH